MHDRLVRLLIFSGPVVRERFSHARHSFRNRKIALESQRRAGSFAQPLLVERATSTRHAASIASRSFRSLTVEAPSRERDNIASTLSDLAPQGFRLSSNDCNQPPSSNRIIHAMGIPVSTVH